MCTWFFQWTHTHLPAWIVEHGHNTEHSIILSLTSAALSHYCTLPVLLLLYFPFSQITPFSFLLLHCHTRYYPTPFSSFHRRSVHASKNEQNSSGRGWVSGEAGGLTCFYIGLMSLEPQTACSQATEWFQYTSHDWNWEVIFHMCTPVRAPELNSMYQSLNLWK